MGFKTGDPKPLNSGRKRNVSNKVTRDIREMIRAALNKAGGISYLVKQAESNPTAFLTLVGKIIPAQINATVDKRDVTELTRDELLERIASARAAHRGADSEDRRGDEPPQVH
jgi:hypothetical protein